ncbi:MAG TPA: L,D-transpeptidase [Spirochaetota bacterium]|nr:L,D-transpeptidase [Spirochaetota bacterium]
MRTAAGQAGALIIAACIIPAALFMISCGDARKQALEKAFSEFRGNHVIYVSKPGFTLYVYDRNGRVAAKYPVAWGLNPDRKPKLCRGDDRTPEGAYRVVELLSMDADRASASYRKLKKMNDVYWRARDGHYRHGNPREDLGDNAYGPRFFLLDYPNDEDRRRYERALANGGIPFQDGAPVPIGHGIAIHGNNDPQSIGQLATSGCVRMFNNDIIELERFIILGTPVIISGD